MNGSQLNVRLPAKKKIPKYLQLPESSDSTKKLYGDMSGTFAGVHFVLVGNDLKSRQSVRSKLISGGGVHSEQYGSHCTHVIVVDGAVYDHPVCIAGRRDGKIVVTSLWVNHSCDSVVPVDHTMIIYRPVRDLNGIPGARDLVVSLTGYKARRREDVMTMISKTGANLSDGLNALPVTHLICYKHQGDEYDRAKKQKTVKLVNHQWLEDCLKLWKLLPEAGYQKSSYELEMMVAQVKDSEEEVPSSGMKQLLGDDDLACGKSGMKRELELTDSEGSEVSPKRLPSFLIRLANEGRHSNEASKPPEGFRVLDFDLFADLYTTLTDLGRGGFGVVYHCRHRVDGLEYAVKAITCNMSDIGNTLRECHILARISHPNVVRYYSSWVQIGIPKNINDGSSKHTHTLYIAMEFCPRTLEADMITRKEGYSTEVKIKIFHGVIKGLAQLEAMKIVHRDLSPDNIFLDEDWNPKIGDFGLARFLDQRITGIVGKDLYCPKEGEEYSTSSDMFSFALCMFDLFYAHHMRTRSEHLKQAKKGIVPLEIIGADSACKLLYGHVIEILKAPPDERMKASVMV